MGDVLLVAVDIHHVWIDSIGIALALLLFNVFAVIRQHLGRGGLARLFLSPLTQTKAPGLEAPDPTTG